MKKFLLAGLIAGVLAAGVMVPQAQARCWWNGYTWHCWHHHSWWWRHHHWHAHHYWYRPYAHYYWYQPYAGYYWSPAYAWSN
jgi:hypothetical protein